MRPKNTICLWFKQDALDAARFYAATFPDSRVTAVRAFSFQIATDNQEETDRYWNAIVDHGGAESACGWCKDRWGLSWRITPRVLTDALAAGGSEAKHTFDAMMAMKKIDIAAIETALRAARQG